MPIMEQICELINENLKLEVDAIDIGVDDSLISLGMDSLSFIRLITALEMKFDIEIDDKYLFIEAINTKNKIVEMIERTMKNDEN